MPLNESERRVLAAIDADALVADLSALVQVPSVTGDEAAVQERAAELCAAAGLQTETWELDLEELRAAPDHPGEEAPRTRGVGVEARLGEGERRLVLNGHLDVVAPGSVPWSRDPWSGAVEDGRVHGRGALDMKGGVTCALHALRAIRAAGVELDGEAVLTPVVSEEDGGLGTFAAIRRLGRIDAAIIPEPTAMELVSRRPARSRSRASCRESRRTPPSASRARARSTATCRCTRTSMCSSASATPASSTR